MPDNKYKSLVDLAAEGSELEVNARLDEMYVDIQDAYNEAREKLAFIGKMLPELNQLLTLRRNALMIKQLQESENK